MRTLVLGLNGVASNGESHESANGVDVQFQHDPGSVGFCGFNRDPQRVRHFLVALAFSQQFEYLLFARRKPLEQDLRAFLLSRGTSGGRQLGKPIPSNARRLRTLRRPKQNISCDTAWTCRMQCSTVAMVSAASRVTSLEPSAFACNL